MAHEVINKVERDYSEVYDAMARRMFIIETISRMARAELGCTWLSDEQKVKYIVGELDIMSDAIKMIKDVICNNFDDIVI